VRAIRLQREITLETSPAVDDSNTKNVLSIFKCHYSLNCLEELEFES
jgi:hypothetical protein